MNRLDYLAQTFRRASHKKYESFCVQRICQQLPLDIKPITQQFISRPSGRALADLYFPQFGIFVEVDEPFHLSQKELDKMREQDIVNATGLSPRRIPIPVGDAQAAEKVAQVCDDIADEIKALRKEAIAKGTFKPWDPEKENDVRTYLERGYIEVADKAQFPTIIECHQLFGYGLKRSKKTFRGAKKHSVKSNVWVLPASKYNSGDWINELSDDGETFFESAGPQCKQDWTYLRNLKKREGERGFSEYHIFLKERDAFGTVCYVFAGNFQIDWKTSDKEQRIVYKKIGDKVKTYTEKQAKRIEEVKEFRQSHAKRIAKRIKKENREAEVARLREMRPKSKRGRKPKMALA